LLPHDACLVGTGIETPIVKDDNVAVSGRLYVYLDPVGFTRDRTADGLNCVFRIASGKATVCDEHRSCHALLATPLARL
jgi:hypothetical protein